MLEAWPFSIVGIGLSLSLHSLFGKTSLTVRGIIKSPLNSHWSPLLLSKKSFFFMLTSKKKNIYTVILDTHII